MMANREASASDARNKPAEPDSSDQSLRLAGSQSSQILFVSYSLSSPEFRQSVKEMKAGEQASGYRQIIVSESLNPLTIGAPEVPALLKEPKSSEATVSSVPLLLRATVSSGTATEQSPTQEQKKTNGTDQPVVSALPVAPAEQMEDRNKTIDPCTRKIIKAIPARADMPKAMNAVKDFDPELFKQIQAKVTDPRYTGELGNITISTHDKKGRVNGCVFVQNVPYWESGAATKALLDVNKELATKGKKLEADPLNGAGRSLAQEEAIVWRNSGLHARVGKSNHGFGKAEDFKPDANPGVKRQPWDDPFVKATLHVHGWRQGDSWGPLKNDLHHWSFVGPGPATDGHPLPHKPVHVTHHKHR